MREGQYIPLPEGVVSAARYSSPRTDYRYELTWDAGPGPTLCTIGLHPSTFEHYELHPVERSTWAFMKVLGMTQLRSVNAFSYRCKSWADFDEVRDPIAPGTDQAIYEAASAADLVIVCWGYNHTEEIKDRCRAVAEMLQSAGVPLFAAKVGYNGDANAPWMLTSIADPEIPLAAPTPWKIS